MAGVFVRNAPKRRLLQHRLRLLEGVQAVAVEVFVRGAQGGKVRQLPAHGEEEAFEDRHVRTPDVTGRTGPLALRQLVVGQGIEAAVDHHLGHLFERRFIVAGGQKQIGGHLGPVQDGAEDLVMQFVIKRHVAHERHSSNRL